MSNSGSMKLSLTLEERNVLSTALEAAIMKGSFSGYEDSILQDLLHRVDEGKED